MACQGILLLKDWHYLSRAFLVSVWAAAVSKSSTVRHSTHSPADLPGTAGDGIWLVLAEVFWFLPPEAEESHCFQGILSKDGQYDHCFPLFAA